jgi:hypothetical protein
MYNGNYVIIRLRFKERCNEEAILVLGSNFTIFGDDAVQQRAVGGTGAGSRARAADYLAPKL